MPHNNATSLQVTVAVLSGMVWAIENPNVLVEPTSWTSGATWKVRLPYLGPVIGKYTDWHPLVERGRLFPEDVDPSDPWQFKNVRVMS